MRSLITTALACTAGFYTLRTALDHGQAHLVAATMALVVVFVVARIFRRGR